ncbi:protein GAMETE EXPRESSED 3 isoform X3 [Carica papaya]|uniref:protein GAMETE EXPRESSED 3 isoform X3 n=1 Tax=Carica papaya TaxID=3649 RepID=UPI000B8CFEC0|nr:protein GAMETE EXPRESSED 3 isoform X3 [Carica papaya]
MRIIHPFFLLPILGLLSGSSHPVGLQQYSAPAKAVYRLSKPLIGDDGRVYVCSEEHLFAFEGNGSIAWSLHLDYKCNVSKAPVHGGRGKIYLIAEDRVLKVDLKKNGTSGSAAENFFSPGPGQEGPIEIIGLAVSTLSSSVFINIKNRGLFAFSTNGRPLWIAGPVLKQFGYRIGCRKAVTDCFFASVPVIDRCEASIYISNTEGELYSLPLRSPHFKWIQDFSTYDKIFTITPGKNGCLYVIMPIKGLVFSLDASSGKILWQRNIGPLSTAEYAPVVDSNGWISIGSVDGHLYSFSPVGVLKKFPEADNLDSVIQVDPYLDCSGYAVYISQTKMEGKISQTIGDYTYISVLRPKSVLFTLLVPATGSIYWSESYPDQFSSFLSERDLQHFMLDERIVLALITASSQKLASSCYQARPKPLGIYTGNRRVILLFLLFESVLLVVLAVLVRFCCIFWRKKKLQGQDLGIFFEKRRSLQLKKKAFDRTITELQQKAAEEAAASEVIEALGNLVREREGVQRKLSSKYSLGGDRAGSQSKSLLPPLYGSKTRSYSFQAAKKESTVTIFHTLSNTSSKESSSESDTSWSSDQENNILTSKGKAKAAMETENSSSGDELLKKDYERSPSQPASSSTQYGTESLYLEQKSGGKKLDDDDREVVEFMPRNRRSQWLKRRRTMSSTN